MTDNSSKKACDYLQAKNQNLQSILAKVKQLTELNTHFVKYIDPNIAQFCYVANVINDRLIVIAADGSVATQLRFEAMELIRKFKADPLLKNIKHIESKVRPSFAPVKNTVNPRRPMQPMSTHTAELVNDIAETLEDPRLREALKRIAKNLSS